MQTQVDELKRRLGTAQAALKSLTDGGDIVQDLGKGFLEIDASEKDRRLEKYRTEIADLTTKIKKLEADDA